MEKQVLVIDNSPEIHQLIKALFLESTIRVSSATNGLDGLVLAESLQPDLILLDVDMPGMDGYAVCAALKASWVLSPIPVIFLTSKDACDRKLQGFHLGAVDYITKPFNPGELIARVRGALRTQARISDMEGRALIDAVTGLGNAKMFEDRMRAEVSERARSPKPLACMALEVDDFPALYKAHGDQFGMQMVRKVAGVIRETFRPEDVPCRMKLQQFAVLMPDTTLNVAAEFAERVKEHVARAPLSANGVSVHLSCSAGVAEAEGAYDHATFRRAVKHMQEAMEQRSDDSGASTYVDVRLQTV